MFRRLIAFTIIFAYLGYSIDIGYISPQAPAVKYALRPYASVMSPDATKSVLEGIKSLLKDKSPDSQGITPLENIKDLIGVIEQLAESSSSQPLSLDRLARIKILLDKLLSAPMSEAIPEEIKKETEEIGRKLKALLTDVTLEDIPAIPEKRPKSLREKMPVIAKRTKELAVSLIPLAIIVPIAIYKYDSYLALRKICLPLVTIFTSLTVALLGDFFRQRAQIISGSPEGMDWKHIPRWGLVSLMFDSPIGYLWHDKCLMASQLQKGFKIAIDQGILAPSFFILGPFFG